MLACVFLDRGATITVGRLDAVRVFRRIVAARSGSIQRLSSSYQPAPLYPMDTR